MSILPSFERTDQVAINSNPVAKSEQTKKLSCDAMA